MVIWLAEYNIENLFLTVMFRDKCVANDEVVTHSVSIISSVKD